MIDSKSIWLFLGWFFAVVSLGAQEDDSSESYLELFEQVYRIGADVPIPPGKRELIRRLDQAGGRAFPELRELYSSTNDERKKLEIISFFTWHEGDKSEFLSMIRRDLKALVDADLISEDRYRPFMCLSSEFLGLDGAADDVDLLKRLQGSNISIVKQFSERAAEQLTKKSQASEAISPQIVADLRETLGRLEGPHELSELSERLTKASPEERQLLLDELVQIVKEEVQLPMHERNYVIVDVSVVLTQVGDEPSILAAFSKDLEKLGETYQFDATRALATCQDPAAVEAIERLARQKMKQIPESDPGPPVSLFDPDGEPLGWQEDPALSFAILLSHLTVSVNPAGKEAVERLNVEFSEAAKGSEYRQKILGVMDEAVDSLVEEQTPEESEGSPVSSAQGKSGDPPDSGGDSTEAASELPIAQADRSKSWIVWSAVLLAGAVALIWRLNSRRA